MRYIRLGVALALVFHFGLGAEVPRVNPVMLQAMREYFHEEKNAAKLAVFGSAVAGGAGVYLATQSDMGRGVGYSLIGVAAIGVIVGGGVYFRTNSQLRRLEDQLETSPEEYKRAETERMARVNAQFKILKIAEFSILGAGIATAITGAVQKADVTTGIGIGLVLDAALLLVFDYFAESRAHLYMQQITDFAVSARTSELIQGLAFDYKF